MSKKIALHELKKIMAPSIPAIRQQRYQPCNIHILYCQATRLCLRILPRKVGKKKIHPKQIDILFDLQLFWMFDFLFQCHHQPALVGLNPKITQTHHLVWPVEKNVIKVRATVRRNTLLNFIAMPSGF